MLALDPSSSQCDLSYAVSALRNGCSRALHPLNGRAEPVLALGQRALGGVPQSQFSCLARLLVRCQKCIEVPPGHGQKVVRKYMHYKNITD